MNEPTDSASFIPDRYVRLLVWVGAVMLGLLIPLKILSLNYLPADDALRHVAKVIADKPWSEILVMRDGFAGDQHPGWHAILGAVYHGLNLDADKLVMFSVVSLFALFWLVTVAARRRPEAMLAALFVGSLTAPGTFSRLMFGRPFLFATALCLVLLQLWTSEKFSARLRMVLTTALLGLSVWIHGSWFLWGVVIAAFLLAQEWRKAVQLGACLAAGTLLAGCLAGRPLDYPLETVRHLFVSFGGQPLDRMLVTEFKPDPGDVVLVGLLLLALVWRVARGQWRTSAVCNPVFLLALLGWLLGLKVSRFWTDWGFPAALLWLAGEVEEVLAEKKLRAYPALLFAGFAAAGVFIATTRDVAGRWTQNLTVEYLTPETPGIGGWLPGKGGIVYASDMAVFYRMFYKNPHAEWRYILGFEPGLMPPDDLEILRKIQWNWYAGKAYEPWVQKMRPADRLIILQGGRPDVSGLEWYFGATDTWIGRLPRKNSDAQTKP